MLGRVFGKNLSTFLGQNVLQLQETNSRKYFFRSLGYLGGQLFRKDGKYLPIDPVSHPRRFES